jgi:hypothetical protein
MAAKDVSGHKRIAADIQRGGACILVLPGPGFQHFLNFPESFVVNDP